MGSGQVVRIGSERRDCLFESKGLNKVTDGAVTEAARVLVAADKFKGSLTAVQVAERVTAGLRRIAPDVEVETLPVADGGDGTVAAAVAAGFDRHEVRVTGPLGEQLDAAFALRDGVAVVEMAEASGLQHLPAGVFAPLTATTYGSGELLRAALDAGARSIVFGVGGSATTDGGAGMLAALGARFLDAAGRPVGPGGGGLSELATADLSGLDPRLAGAEIVLASDVDNPLTGPKGAPAVYGPQKGASPEQVEALDSALAHFAAVLEKSIGPKAAEAALAPGAGAAGGIGYGALVGLGAGFRAGIDVMLDVLGFAPRWAGRPWSSPARARSTSRPCTARPRPVSPRRPGRRARRSSRSAAVSRSRPMCWAGPVSAVRTRSRIWSPMWSAASPTRGRSWSSSPRTSPAISWPPAGDSGSPRSVSRTGAAPARPRRASGALHRAPCPSGPADGAGLLRTPSGPEYLRWSTFLA